MNEAFTREASKRSAQVLRFTTEGISPSRRIQLWAGHNSRALIPLDIHTIEASPMSAQQVNLHLPSVRIAKVSASPQLVERSEAFINNHPTGMVVIFFITGGESFFYHRGGHILLQPGQAIAYDADRPFVHGVSRGFQELALTIPLSVYVDLVGSEGPELPAVFNFDNEANAHEQALARHLRKTLDIAFALANPDSADRARAPAELARAEEIALGLVRSSLVAPASSASGMVAAAKDFIYSRLHDPDLSPEEIAAAVGIGKRQLARLFSGLDTTLGRYVQAKRLELAAELLASPQHGSIPIAQLAAQCGFRSRSNFSVVFRETYDMTPLEWRKRAKREYLQP